MMNRKHADAARSRPRDLIGGGDDGDGELASLVADNKHFGLRLADTSHGRNMASLLIDKMYSWRGYAGTHRLNADPNRVTLIATHAGNVVGTLTVGIDSPAGILADELFKEEVDAFRARGARVCEFTKLAFDAHVQSKAALAALIHVTIMHARDVYHCTDMFIEVNPRHRRFYENMLGFKRLGEPKNNPRVDAPAYLLWVSLDYMYQQITLLAGRPPEGNRSLYPLFFSPREAAGILQRILPRS
jgi:hypothetical protein